MAKFAFVIPPLEGHINPTLSIGRRLLERGHTVGWICVEAPGIKEKLPEGAKALIIQHHLSEDDLSELTKNSVGISIQGIESLKILYEDVLIPFNQFLLEGIVSYLKDFEPDIVVYDQQMFAGAVASYRLKIPFVASVTAPSSIRTIEALPKLHEWEDNQVISFQQRNGVPFDDRLDEHAEFVLVYTSDLFFGEHKLSQQYKFVGPVTEARPNQYTFDWDRFRAWGDIPKILVSIGTTFIFEEKINFFLKVMEAFKNEEIGVVVISDPDLFDEIPANFIIQKRIPQLQILPFLQVVVCHAGQNTVSESLSHGIPLVTIPVAYDQSQVAESVVKTGAGIRLKFNRFRPKELRDAVYEILNNSIYAENAGTVRDSFIQCGGVDAAVGYLEELVD
ncbi:MAG: glycosyl transferase [Dysgonamonadaceae bacterium]|jgi:MGT family glycosyltransferase|nr:glycosyl transferase [Dysgonamonadaceae bacterium]